MKFTSSSKDHDAGCGFLQRTKIQLCFTRQSVGYFGAVRLRDGRFFFRREVGRFHGETFWDFLRYLHPATVEPGRGVILISDHARYHRSRLHLTWRQQLQPQLALDFLPPYGPELNPIEGVWKLTRRLCLHNPYVGFLESVMEAVEVRFADWLKPNETSAGYAQIFKTLRIDPLGGHEVHKTVKFRRQPNGPE